MRRLLLHLPGAGDAVVVRVGLALREQLLDEHVDGWPVLGVHHRHEPGVGGNLHGAEDLRVVGVEDAGVRHEHLVAGDAFVDELRHRGEGVGVDASDDLVEPVVDRAVAGGLLMPRCETVEHFLALRLHGEVDDARRASPRGGARAGLEGVDRGGAAEGQLHVGVGVNAAGDDVLARRIDDGVDGARKVVAEERRAGAEDGDDRLAVDEDVGCAATRGAHDGAAGDECRGHGFTTAV